MPTFLQLCAQPAYAPVPSGAADTTSWTADGAAFVTSGPYTVAAWTTDGLTYTKNPAYWDADNVAVEAVRFVFQSDANAAASAFLAREYALSWPYRMTRSTTCVQITRPSCAPSASSARTASAFP